MKQYFVFLMIIILAFVGCNKKKETPPVPVGEMTEYKDPGFGFVIQYPKEWKQLGASGKAIFVKSQEVSNKFMDPQTGEEGGQVTVEVLKLDGKTPDDVIATSKGELKQAWSTVEIQPDQTVTVANKQAVKVAYTIPVTSKTNISGYNIYVPGDTAVYRLDFVGYGDQFTAHTAVFEAMLKTFALPVIMVKSDKWAPSPNLQTYKSDFFTMQYPENMEFQSGVKKGDKDLVMELWAGRYDCSIHFDVFGAKKLTVDKVWEQNKGKFKAKQTGETNIDGNKSHWVEYTNSIKGTSRTYFVVKNDKVIRVTTSWFPPERDIYYPVFEKALASVKIK